MLQWRIIVHVRSRNLGRPESEANVERLQATPNTCDIPWHLQAVATCYSGRGVGILAKSVW